MKATELKFQIDQAIPADARAQRAVCDAFRVLRDFLKKNVTSGKGVGGFFFRTFFPETSKGLTAVVTLLDEYLAENCAGQ